MATQGYTANSATAAPKLDGFQCLSVATKQGSIFLHVGGSGFPILLLHGFPETSLMWHAIAPILSSEFTIIAADLPGYGLSECPRAEENHAAMSKRSMAASLVAVMQKLGHQHFAIVGHDRGGRVAYRAALDHPDRVAAIAVLDIIPTFDVWERADARMALAFWPFLLLAQPARLPEQLISAAPDMIINHALAEWGSSPDTFPSWLRTAYVEVLRDRAHVHAICEEYRAAATIDRKIDRNDLEAGRRIECPLLALWSSGGPLDTWYEHAGGPLATWRRWAGDVRGMPVEGGHFFPEERPDVTAKLIRKFLQKCAAAP